MVTTTLKENNTYDAARGVGPTVAQVTAMLNVIVAPSAAPSSGITQLTGDITAGPGSGSQAATVAGNAVGNAKLAPMPAHTFKGNNSGSRANPSDLTAS